MTKRTLPLESSRRIYLPCRISLDSEIVEISRFSRHEGLRGTWHDATWHHELVPHGIMEDHHMGGVGEAT